MLLPLLLSQQDLASLIGEVIIGDLKREDEIQREAVEWLEVNRKHVEPGSNAWKIELDQKREQIAIQRGYFLP